MVNPSGQLEIAPGWWYRCFGARENRTKPCDRPATRRSADPRRFDAITFWCDEHAPDLSEPIGRDQHFVELAIAGLIVMAGSTLRLPDTQLESVTAIESVLGSIGATFCVAEHRVALKRPVYIIGAGRAQDAPAGRTSGDRAGGGDGG